MHRVWGKYPVEQMRLGRGIRRFIEGKALHFGGLGTVARWLGALGGILTAVVDVISGLEAKDNGDYPIAILRLSVAGITVAATVAMFLSAITAAVGFIIFLVLAALSLFGEWVINLVRDNKIEVWLGRTPFGTEQSERFISLSAQDEAWEILLGQKK